MTEDVTPYGAAPKKPNKWRSYSRLTEAQQKRVYKAVLLRRRLCTKNLAIQYGVSKSTIEKICRRLDAAKERV